MNGMMRILPLPARLWRLGVTAVLVPAGMAGCGGDGGPAGPQPGTLVATLTTPNGDDGAILVRINGPGITQVVAGRAGDYLKVLQEGNTVTAVVVGELDSGALIRFDVPDLETRSSYGASILQVADESNALRGSLAGYSLALAPAASGSS
jgi:hypothetical protein